MCETTCGDGVRAGTEACDDGDTTDADGCSATCTIESGYTCTGTAPSVCTTSCGDGVRAGAEACDDGNTAAMDGCAATCAIETGYTCTGDAPSVCVTTCGDGVRAGLEACDDGDTTDADGCSATCTIETGYTCTGTAPSVCTTTCGDGVRAGTEQCDDGDTTAGDGCSAACAVELGWTCDAASPTVCATTCGDGIRAGAEACDDGGLIAMDGCSETCTVEPGWSCAGTMPDECEPGCGDGLVRGTEACDDGNLAPGDGCSAACAVEPGYSCTGDPSVCVSSCGDGTRAGAERCDDGNLAAMDGCSPTCEIEEGWDCDDEAPSVCATTCGDGIRAGMEACDDGNAAAGDGCSDMCAVEPGFACTPGRPDVCVDDGDGDGVRDPDDNCPAVANPGQEDQDEDGLGDACDGDANGDGFPDDIGVEGGGCATGGPGGAGTLLLVAAAALFLARRRRGARAAIGAALVALALGGVRPAAAQEMPDESARFAVERLQLGVDRGGVLGIEAAALPGAGSWEAGLWLGLSDDPLTLYRTGDDERVGALVGQRVGGELVGAYTITRWLQVGLGVPLVASQTREAMVDDVGMLGSLQSYGVGDVRVQAKVGLLRQRAHGLDLALVAPLELPAGSGGGYLGDDMVGFAPALAIGRRAGRVRLAATVGYQLRDRQQLANLVVDDELFAQVGAGIDATARLGLDVALGTATAADDPFATDNRTYLEAMGGPRYAIGRRWIVFAAGGAGLGQGYGTPDWRALAGLRFGDVRPADRIAPPPPAIVDTPIVTPEPVAEPEPPPPPPADGDGDGLSDDVDRCPTEAEDLDGFEDGDGCPELDDDGDQVADAGDGCPREAGPIENRGCPDTDRDGDQIVDRLDNCPDEPGTAANAGCRAKQTAVLENGAIKLREQVHFATNQARIRRKSKKLLDNVARVLAAHPELAHVTIEGHTDDVGDRAHNLDLSQRRAEAVVAALVIRGVVPERLTAIGYGPDRPLVPNASRKQRAANRRVEIKTTVGESGAGVSPSTPAPAAGAP